MDALIKTPYNTGMYTLYDLPMKDAANNEILETLQTIYATGLEPDYDDPSEKEAMEAEVVNYDDRQVIGAIRQQLQRRNVLIAKNRNFALLPEEECLVETVCARKYYTYYKDNEVFNINYEAYGSFYVTNQRLVFVDEKNNVESCPISEIIAYSTLDLSALVFKKADNTSIVIDYTLEGRFVEVPKHLQRQGYYDKVFYDERARCILALQKVLPDKYDGLATIRKVNSSNNTGLKNKRSGCIVMFFVVFISALSASMFSCSKDDDNETKAKEETKTGAYDWILDYMRIVNMKDVHSSPISIDTLHIDTLYSRTKEEIKGMVDAYNKTEQYATADGTKYISNVIVAHNYTEMRTIKKDWGYMYHYTNDEIKKNQSLYRSCQGSYKNITEVAALDSARAIRKKYGHDLLWFLLTKEATGFPIYEYGSSTATK